MGAFAMPSHLVPSAGEPPRTQFLPARLEKRVALTGERVSLPSWYPIQEVPPLQRNHDGTPTLACDCYHLGNRRYFLPVKVGHSHTHMNPHRPFLSCPYPKDRPVPRCHFWVWVDQLPVQHHAVALRLLKTERFCSTFAPEAFLELARARAEENQRLFGSSTEPHSHDSQAVRELIFDMTGGRQLRHVSTDELREMVALLQAAKYESERVLGQRMPRVDAISAPPAAPAQEQEQDLVDSEVDGGLSAELAAVSLAPDAATVLRRQLPSRLQRPYRR